MQLSNRGAWHQLCFHLSNMAQRTSKELLKKLSQHSAIDLARFIADLAAEDPDVARSAELFLARDDAKVLAKEINSSISGLKRSSRFIDYEDSDQMARKLHCILDSIERHLLGRDPVLALRTLGTFIETDANIIGNADDSNGVIGDAYHRACMLLGRASIAAGKPKEAEDVFLSLHDGNDYGTRDAMFDEAVNILSPDAVQRVVAAWRERARGEDPMASGGIRYRLSALAESIGDPELNEEARLCGRPVEEFPLVAIEVARVYLKCGKPEIALTKVPSEAACRHPDSRSAILTEIYSALGNTAELAKVHWSDFAREARAEDARSYLDCLPETDHPAAMKRMRATVLAGEFTPLCKATYFADMGDADTAAQIVESAPGTFASEYYEGLLHLVKYLEAAHPLAATILHRANFESLLAKNSSKYYLYAAQNAKKMAVLAPQVTDWKNIMPHERYWQIVRQANARRRALWSAIEEAGV